MTAELNQLANDPNFVIELAIGSPFDPELKPQERTDGISFQHVYFNKPKRYVMKKAHISKDDIRIFDVDTKKVVMVSHHPGKDPYDTFDPLGTAPGPKTDVMGGEWESVCDITGRGRFKSFKIRPKQMSMHGRQYVKTNDTTIILNVGKMGKLKTQSIRPHFGVGEGEDTDDLVYTCIADMLGRTISITNQREELVAQICKTEKALLQTAVFGSGSESTIDIAPGVDCSTILAIVYAIQQVGNHFVKDAFGNFVQDPLQDAAIDSAVEATGTSDYLRKYNQLSQSATKHTKQLRQQAKQFQKFFN